MNHQILLEHVASELHTMLCVYNNKSNKPYCICKIPEYAGIERLMLPFLDKLKEPAGGEYADPSTYEYYPKLTIINSTYIYATVFVKGHEIIAGPIKSAFGDDYIYRVDYEGFKPEEKYNLTSTDGTEAFKLMALVHNLYNHITINSIDIIYHNSGNSPERTHAYFTKTIFQNQEHEIKHNSYLQEKREFGSIRDGDIERLKQSWQEDIGGELGILAETPLRNKQNLAIVLITLASRYAIEGGLEPEIAYTLADSYVMRVEKCRNPQTAEYLGKEAELEYTRMVKEVREIKKRDDEKWKNNPIIQECKNYIYTHLHGKITVSDIAAELHVNESYLSSLFKRTDGRSIVEYINHQKVKLVKNLLVYSDYSFIDIANYLGFCSQSHLGKIFKEETGTTLNRYRKENAMKDFSAGKK